jgi:hypothetical protein
LSRGSGWRAPGYLTEPQHGDIWAVDLLTAQTPTCKTLYVLDFISHARRGLVRFNVTASPTAAWVWRQLIEATPRGCVWGAQRVRPAGTAPTCIFAVRLRDHSPPIE